MTDRPDTPPDPNTPAGSSPGSSGPPRVPQSPHDPRYAEREESAFELEAEIEPRDEDELNLDELRLVEEDETPEYLRDLDISAPESPVPTKALEESDVPIENEPASQRDESLRTARLITVACYRNLPLFGKRQIKDALVQDLKIVTRKKPFRLLAWCVMPEHAHFLLYPRVDDPSPLEIIRTAQQRFAIRIVRRWREINATVLDEITDPLGSVHIWQREPHEDLIITRTEEIPRVITLIETKPVRRGLVDEATHWSWSSAKRRAGDGEHGLAIEDV